MKTFFMPILLLLTLNISANELKWVDEQIQAIKPPRSGVKAQEISKIKDPFILLSKKTGGKMKNASAKRKPSKQTAKSEEAAINSKFDLSITMNKSAMINEKWYKQGDTISGYKIEDVASSSVLLTQNGKKFLLSTHSKNTNLNFKN